MQYSILSQINPFVKRKKENYEKNFAPKHQPKGLAAGKQNAAHQKQLVVFIVGSMIPRINRRLDADLVTLSIPTLRVGSRGTEPLCPFVTLSKRGLYPLWLHTTVISARVEVLLFEIARCLWICSSFYSNFEKQNRKGSPQSLIYPLKDKLTSFVIKQFLTPKRNIRLL